MKTNICQRCSWQTTNDDYGVVVRAGGSQVTLVITDHKEGEPLCFTCAYHMAKDAIPTLLNKLVHLSEEEVRYWTDKESAAIYEAVEREGE